MQLHFQSNKGEEGITRPLPSHDLHGLGSSPELPIEPFDDVGGSQRNPFFLGAIEDGQAGIEGFFQTLKRRGELYLPFCLELSEKLSCLLPGGCVENGAHPVSDGLLEFLRHFGQNISSNMDLAALNLGLGELLGKNLLKAGKTVHDTQDNLRTIKAPSFQILEKLSPGGCGLLVADLEPEYKPLAGFGNPDCGENRRPLNGVSDSHVEIDSVNEKILDLLLGKIPVSPSFI